MLSGDNGILQKATSAKEQTGIGQEKEIVSLAYNSALAKKVGSGDSTPVTSEDMNTELTTQEATASGSNPIIVTFTVSKRKYTINDGSIEYAGIKNEDEIVPEGKVAKIGTTYYDTLQNAFDAVSANNTQTEVILLTNISENVLINSNKNIVLNLNSKTLTNSNSSNESMAIMVNESGVLELKNGNIISDYGLCIANLGNTTIVNGTFSATNSIVIANAGTLNINGGTFNGTAGGNSESRPTVNNAGNLTIIAGAFNSTISDTISNTEMGTLSISGGSISHTGLNRAIYNNGTLAITGGTISSTGTFAIENSGGTATVSGATINGETSGLE